MSKNIHPIEQEELMAYFDGELETERAAEAVSHLERCPECQQLAADLKEISLTMREWQVPAGPEKMAAINAALEEYEKEFEEAPAKKAWWRRIVERPQFRMLAWGFAGSSVVALVLAVVFGSMVYRRQAALTATNQHSVLEGYVQQKDKQSERSAVDSAPSTNSSPSHYVPQTPAKSTHSKRTHGDSTSTAYSYFNAANGAVSFSSDAAPVVVTGGTNAWSSNALSLGANTSESAPTQALNNEIVPTTTYSGPMIVRAAALTLTAKQFDQSRTQIEAAVSRHHGYIGELTTQGNSGAGRTLSAKLRVPADQLNALITEMRQIGHVDSEAQTGDEVTQQYVDLQARLKNARNTEQRLTDLLQHRTGKLSDVLEVEQEIDRVTGEIEEMEAERKSMLKQVDFASLSVTLNEEYKAPIQQAVPGSTSTRLGNAVVEGFKIVADAILGFALFLATYGPILLLWAAILFFPVRAIWKRVRKAIKA